MLVERGQLPWRRSMLLRRLNVLPMLVLFPIPALADFRPIGEFRYALPDNVDFYNAGPDGVIAAIGERDALAGFERQNAIAGIAGIYDVAKSYFSPTSASLQAVQDAEDRSDSAAAKAAAGKALGQWNDLKNTKKLGGIYTFLAHTGNNKPIGDLANAFFKYAISLQDSVSEAQSVPSLIDSFIKSNEAGIRLRLAADISQGVPYGPGMKCSDLVIDASE
jgi:hypothetical protein